MAASAVLLVLACSSSEPRSGGVLLPPRPSRDAGVDVGADAAGSDVEAPPPEDAAPPDTLCTAPSLVLCLSFEGAVADGSPNKLAPTLAAGAAFAPGKQGTALVAGPQTAIRFGFSDALNVTAATAEAWVNIDAASTGDDTVFDSDLRFAMTVEQDGTLRCNTSLAASRAGSVPRGQWVHVACVFDGTTIKNYVDGVERGSAPSTLAQHPTAGAAVADNSPDGGEQLLGMVDSLRVFSVARSAADIAASASSTAK